MANLFTHYPKTTYNNYTSTNIMVRAAFQKLVKDRSVLFYPHTVLENERPDSVAYQYYGDSKYDWVVLLANNIVDPYYDWPLSNYDFYKFIIDKYGSTEAASANIAFWRVNWYNDDTSLSISGYNALNTELKKYWDLDSELGTSYKRKAIDTAVETNKVIELVVASSTGFTIGEKITQTTDGIITASGYVKGISDNTLVCSNILGTFNTSKNTVGASATSNTTSVTTISTSIPAAELQYWEAVSFYDYENELNENKKHISILDKSFLSKLEKEVRDLFYE